MASKKKKKKRLKPVTDDLIDYTFDDVYELTGQVLGTGARSTVVTCIKRTTREEYAVKVL